MNDLLKLNPTPVRIQLRRIKGWRLQEFSRELNGLPAVNCSRPGRWGNPFKVERFGLDLSLELFARTVRGIWTKDGIEDFLIPEAYQLRTDFLNRHGHHPMENARVELKKHNLACFCKTDQKCHCDELLKISNA
jgi:hypothetical protein